MLIGLYGKARSGKTTVSDYLQREHRFGDLSFAHPLKALVAELFDMTLDQLYDETLKEKIDLRYGMSPRRILQHLGTDVFREIYPNIWVDHLIRRYRKIKSPGLRFVVSDVRFKNEKEAIEKEGGVVWKIVRKDNPGSSSGIQGHQSECDLDDISDSAYAAVLVAESGDVKGLLEKANKEVERLFKEMK